MKKSQLFIGIILLLFIASVLCYKKQSIDYKIVKEIILTHNPEKTNSDISALKYDVSQKDTLKYNLRNTFEESDSLLKSKLAKMDSIASNKETKDYIKSLIIADFVYAAFSFQFLGPKLGMAQDASSIKNWNKITIKNCFDLGNKNQYAVFCGQRTIFYNRLIAKLLKLKTKEVSIKGIHTFPIVIIGGKDYSIDPYDPFVVIDTLEKNILDYNSILEKHYKALKPIRTKRIFGSSRMLISRKLYDEIKKTYGTMNLDRYLIDNEHYLSTFKPKNFETPLEKTKKIQLVLNDKNILAININGRIDGNLITEKDFYKFYIESSH
jgi:hypothetical protein